MNQRTANNGKGNNRISKEQIQKLEEIDFEWSPSCGGKVGDRSRFIVMAKPTGPLLIKMGITLDFKTVVEEMYKDPPLLGQVQAGDYLESINWDVDCNKLTIEEIKKCLGIQRLKNRVLEFSRSIPNRLNIVQSSSDGHSST